MRGVLLCAGPAAALVLSGCVAAAVPAVAAAGVYKAAQDGPGKKERKRKRGKAAVVPQPGREIVTEGGQRVIVTDMRSLPPPSGASGAVPVPIAGREPPPAMQYLYGSGEAAALSIQAYRALWNYIHVEIGFRRDKTQAPSVVLSPGSTLENPRFELCGKRPLAVVLDVDETVLLNLGFEADEATRTGPYDATRWSRWEQTGIDKVAAVPGAAETLAAIRGEGVTVVFNSNRSAASAAQTAAAIDHAGLGPAVLGDTLWLKGEGEGSGKDARRAKIAEKYCIVAMAGDQLGDFSDLFNTPGVDVQGRRNRASQTMLSPLWGAGWFMLPNPVYGTALHGTLDEVFPPDVRWADPEEKK